MSGLGESKRGLGVLFLCADDANEKVFRFREVTERPGRLGGDFRDLAFQRTDAFAPREFGVDQSELSQGGRALRGVLHVRVAFLECAVWFRHLLSEPRFGPGFSTFDILRMELIDGFRESCELWVRELGRKLK